VSMPTHAARLYRNTGDRVVAGVASGIAGHLGASVLLIRLALVVLASYQGLGAILYAVFWAVLPASQAVPARRNLALAVPFAALGIGAALVLNLALPNEGPEAVAGWLVAVVAFGAGIIWHQADPKRRERWSEALPQAPWLAPVVDGERPGYLLRFIGGGVLVTVGIIGVVAMWAPVRGAGLAPVLYGVFFALTALAGVGMATAPVLRRTYTQLRAEREARIREQERAEVAAMIHDQVLHTLALIQRNAGDGKAVVRLARGQERTLRNWLYRSTASPTERLGAALEQVAAEVEDTYAIAVETVMVGDLEVDEGVAALVAAAREALVNAGRHAKVSTVSLYAEVEPDCVSAFIRDRGVGFDVTAVEDDRHGVRGSIIGRMQRHGGKAEIRSEPGDGTEVRLSMPISTEARRRRAEEGQS